METEEKKYDLKDICKRLYKAGVSKVVVEFSGCGDSGEIVGVKYQSKNEKEFTSEEFKGIVLEKHFPEIGDLDDVIGWSAADHIDGDWYNNDGGQGFIYIDTKNAQLRIEVGYNYMATEEKTEEVNL